MKIDPKKILALPMEENDADATTVRGYLVALLTELWDEGEGFSGKRPFGNSGWEFDLYKPLIQAKVIKGSFDSDGYLQDYDADAGNKVIRKVIKSLGEE